MILHRRASILGLLLAAVLLVSPAASAGGDDPQATERGWLLFALYCSGCHGNQGRGDGPVASELSVRPADLTRIAKRNKGVFDTGKVYAKIYGLDRLPGHRKSEMPLWGFEFQQVDLDVNQQSEVRARIEQLVDYLATIQQTD